MKITIAGKGGTGKTTAAGILAHCFKDGGYDVLAVDADPDYMNEFTGALFLPHTDMELFPSVKVLFQRSSR